MWHSNIVLCTATASQLQQLAAGAVVDGLPFCEPHLQQVFKILQQPFRAFVKV